LTVASRNEPGIALIAGGVGIAPLIGIPRQLRIEGDTRPTTLVFGKPDSQKWLYVLCGPAEMMEIVEDTLADMGVPSNQILSERFKYD
jgi:ferredoxin-NADP reductase